MTTGQRPLAESLPNLDRGGEFDPGRGLRRATESDTPRRGGPTRIPTRCARRTGSTRSILELFFVFPLI